MRTSKLWPLALGIVALMGCSNTTQITPPKGPGIAVGAPDPSMRAAPAPEAADYVSFDAAPANRFTRAGEAGEMVVRLRLGAKALKDAPKAPVNLALVVDTSGSMEGEMIEDAKKASLALLDALSPGDTLAVVAFHSRAEVLTPATRINAKNAAKIREQISAMKAHGTTDMAGGLRAGIDEVVKGLRADGVNRIVLLGDGVPNNEAPIVNLAQAAGRSGVAVTALGLGLDYNETLMNAVAQHSGGKFHFVRDSGAVASVFKEEVLRLKRVVGKNAALKLSPGPGVIIKGVVGLPTSVSGTDTVVMLGDMSEGDQRDVIVRVAAAGRRAGSVVELFDAAVSFDVTSGFSSARLEERSFVAVRATSDQQELSAGRDIDVERSAARISVADRIVQAIAAARMGQLSQAQAMLDAIEKDAKRTGKQLEDEELLEKAKTIPALKESLPSLVQRAEHPIMPVKVSAAGSLDARPMPMPAARPNVEVVMEAQASAVQTIQGN
jgi:Ca-activated chloride channel family protein